MDDMNRIIRIFTNFFDDIMTLKRFAWLLLIMLFCAARTPRTPHAALALLPLEHCTRRATTAHAAPALALHSPRTACGRLERPCTRAPVPPARRGACVHTGRPTTHAWACGRLERPCTRAPVPPARGACTRAGQQRTTTHDDGKMLSAHTGATKPIDADQWGTAKLDLRPCNGVAAFLLPCDRGSHRHTAVVTRPRLSLAL